MHTLCKTFGASANRTCTCTCSSISRQLHKKSSDWSLTYTLKTYTAIIIQTWIQSTPVNPVSPDGNFAGLFNKHQSWLTCQKQVASKGERREAATRSKVIFWKKKTPSTYLSLPLTPNEQRVLYLTTQSTTMVIYGQETVIGYAGYGGRAAEDREGGLGINRWRMTHF